MSSSNYTQEKEILDKPGALVGWAKNQPPIPFAQIANEFCRNKDLSVNCIALLLYLMSHDPSFEIRVYQIKNHFKGRMGRSSVEKAIKEACDAGYMRQFSVAEGPERGTKGNLKRIRYEFHRTPVFKKSFPCTNSQDTEIPDVENRCTETGSLGHIEKNTIPKKASKLAGSSDEPGNGIGNDDQEAEIYGFEDPEPEDSGPTITREEAAKTYAELRKRKVGKTQATHLAVRYTGKELWDKIKRCKSQPVHMLGNWLMAIMADDYPGRKPSRQAQPKGGGDEK